mgnify:CR=1 FL=1
MNKQELYVFLDERKIKYTAIEHVSVYTVEEAEKLCLPHPEAGAKNLFLRDDKKRNYYLLTVRDALPIDLKQFQERIGSRRLSFASEEDLMCFLALKKGAVTPFGVLNDTQCTVQVYIDAYFENKQISVHPNENNATVYLAANDLVELLRAHGNKVEYIELGKK